MWWFPLSPIVESTKDGTYCHVPPTCYYFKDIQWVEGYTYEDVYMRNEKEQAAASFEHYNTEKLLNFCVDEEECKQSDKGLAMPAYDQCIKSSSL